MTDDGEADAPVVHLLDRMAYVLAYHADEIPAVPSPFGPEFGNTVDWKWIIDRAMDDAYWSEAK